MEHKNNMKTPGQFEDPLLVKNTHIYLDRKNSFCPWRGGLNQFFEVVCIPVFKNISPTVALLGFACFIPRNFVGLKPQQILSLA